MGRLRYWGLPNFQPPSAYWSRGSQIQKGPRAGPSPILNLFVGVKFLTYLMDEFPCQLLDKKLLLCGGGMELQFSVHSK